MALFICLVHKRLTRQPQSNSDSRGKGFALGYGVHLCFSFHRLLVTTHNTMQEATSPENFLITKATRLFAVGWLCAYDVKSTNWNFLRSKA